MQGHPIKFRPTSRQKRQTAAVALAAAVAAPYAARPFGRSRDDLDIDLGDGNRPGLVTRVLASCLGGFADPQAAEDCVWEWALTERLQGLLAIAIAGGCERTALQMRCRDCGTGADIDLPVSNFVTPPRRNAVVCRMPDGSEIAARLPLGSDQHAWRAAAADPIVMATTLIERIGHAAPRPSWRTPPDWLEPLADALADADPLTTLQLQAACPNCGHVNVIDFDLEGWLLAFFADEQERLIDDVHKLAAVYHWSEEAICALPPRRRRAYLARIKQEAGP